MNRIVSHVDRFWWNTCGITVAVLVASRALRYAANALPSPLEELTGHLLAFQFRASITAAATLPFQGVACALVLLILLIRPRWLLSRKKEGGVILRGWFSGLIWGLLALDVVEKLPSGAGGRNGHLSSDGRYLFTGGGGRHVAWQLD
jgi:hypothetical protein